ncbi:hypothetical protein RJT34_18197 [Clitoria ternatea]|uniref:Uncharacterized protein n=1 Tax=Clitoria ternatea TaxID=43366 RepID=A0AAN9JBU9_CLITE
MTTNLDEEDQNLEEVHSKKKLETNTYASSDVEKKGVEPFSNKKEEDNVSHDGVEAIHPKVDHITSKDDHSLKPIKFVSQNKIRDPLFGKALEEWSWGIKELRDLYDYEESLPFHVGLTSKDYSYTLKSSEDYSLVMMKVTTKPKHRGYHSDTISDDDDADFNVDDEYESVEDDGSDEQHIPNYSDVDTDVEGDFDSIVVRNATNLPVGGVPSALEAVKESGRSEECGSSKENAPGRRSKECGPLYKLQIRPCVCHFRPSMGRIPASISSKHGTISAPVSSACVPCYASPSNGTNSPEFVLQLADSQTCSPATARLQLLQSISSHLHAIYSRASLHVCHMASMQDFVSCGDDFQ